MLPVAALPILTSHCGGRQRISWQAAAVSNRQVAGKIHSRMLFHGAILGLRLVNTAVA
jgi:hypothetical protein